LATASTARLTIRFPALLAAAAINAIQSVMLVAQEKLNAITLLKGREREQQSLVEAANQTRGA
jgi:hypothetical protein